MDSDLFLWFRTTGGNAHATTLQVIPLTSKCKNKLPVHLKISGFGLKCESTLLAEQIQTVDKSILRNRVGIVDDIVMEQVNVCIMIQLGVLV